MNQIIKVGDKDYPFHFGMRVFWYISNSGEIEFDEVSGAIHSDFDAFLEMFLKANHAALKKTDGNKLDVTTLEFAIDENPKLMKELQEALQNSSVAKKLEEQAEKEGNAKKPKG